MPTCDSSLHTFNHIRDVQELLLLFTTLLSDRGINHDASKLLEPEKSVFDEFTPKLKSLTYGSEDYKTALKEMGTALQHHYTENEHHPEHHADGIAGMSLIDIVEMFCDWQAATKRHEDGSIFDSIQVNTKRFGIDEQLKQIFLNTVDEMELGYDYPKGQMIIKTQNPPRLHTPEE